MEVLAIGGVLIALVVGSMAVAGVLLGNAIREDSRMVRKFEGLDSTDTEAAGRIGGQGMTSPVPTLGPLEASQHRRTVVPVQV